MAKLNGVSSDPKPQDTAPNPPRLRDEGDAAVAPGVRIAAAWTWRLLVLLAGIVVLGMIFKRFEDVLFPVALAVLFAAFLHPVVEWLVGQRVPRVIAVLVPLLVSFLVLLGVLSFVVQQAISGGPQLVSEFTRTVGQTRDWLITGPLRLDDDLLKSAAEQLIGWVKSHEGKLASSAIGTAAFGSRIGTGILLTVFVLIFFLYDGAKIWNYVTKLVPAAGRERVRGAGAAGFGTLESYVRATVIVAAIDASVIGIGLAFLGVPMVLPLVAIIFLGSFIPIVGSFVAGSLAVFVALTTQGWVNALIVLGILVFVMAVEGHVLQPFLLGYSVKLHPVAVILAIAIGIMLAGIVGGLLAVPLVAFLDTALSWRPGKVPEPHKDSRLTAWIRRVVHRGGSDTRPEPAAGTGKVSGSTDSS